MKPDKFEILLGDTLQKINDTLSRKAKEYAHGGDRLYNFKAAAQLSGQKPEVALWGMAVKHLVSVTDLITGNLEANEENVDEKIIDLINYLILLSAIFKERL